MIPDNIIINSDGSVIVDGIEFESLDAYIEYVNDD